MIAVFKSIQGVDYYRDEIMGLNITCNNKVTPGTFSAI